VVFCRRRCAVVVYDTLGADGQYVRVDTSTGTRYELTHISQVDESTAEYMRSIGIMYLQGDPIAVQTTDPVGLPAIPPPGSGMGFFPTIPENMRDYAYDGTLAYWGRDLEYRVGLGSLDNQVTKLEKLLKSFLRSFFF
jgi:hypothetical protein